MTGLEFRPGHHRGPIQAVPLGQVTRVLEVLAEAERLVATLADQVITGQRGILVLPPEGYALRLVERDALRQALDLTGWVQAHAAALLQITPRVMHHKIHRHGLCVPRGVARRPWKDDARPVSRTEAL